MNGEIVNSRRTDTGARARQGFSLVEVNLAILLVGVGLFAIFALFPRGLQESDMAVQDTQEAMFGNAVISAIEGNAAAITDWNTWSQLAELDKALSEGAVMQDINLVVDGAELKAYDDELEFPLGSDPKRYITFQLRIIPRGDTRGRVLRVTLQVASGRNRTIAMGRDYYTELVYKGE